MSPEERRLMAELDDVVLGASDEELKQLQEIDIASQLKGMSFYDVYVNSKGITNPTIKEKTQSRETNI